MKPEAFNVPQRQSVIGILLLFFTSIFKFLRGVWVLGVFFLLSSPDSITTLLVLSGFVFAAVIALFYSFLYYKNFLFHIDYGREEFVLQKGVISTQNLAVPFDKIQQVYLKRSLLQRALNVYSVVIDTAGSKEDEVNIPAVSREDAQELSSILMKVKKEEIKPGKNEDTDQTEKIWTHELGLSGLLKIGISTNYLRGLALILAFFTTLYNELHSFLEEGYLDQYGTYFKDFSGITESVSFMFGVIFILLIMSILLTVIEVFFKYYGLKLEQTREKLTLEMGLKTNTRVALQPRRVQLISVTTNPVQRWLNLYEAQIALASAQDELGKDKIKIPGLGKSTVKKVKDFLYGEVDHVFEKSFRPHYIFLVRRIAFILLPVILSYLVLTGYNYMSLTWWVVGAVLFTVAGIFYQVLFFRSLELIISDNLLKKKKGVWSKTEENFELYKIQALSVRQPIWYRRRKLINVVFHTAGGDVMFRGVNDSVQLYLNYILFKAEVSKKHWM